MALEKEQEKKALSISYYTKQKQICPACKTPYAHEDLLSGGGRLIAGDLTDELHRTYQPSIKYGIIYPLIYSVGVCPNCYTAFYWSDMKLINDKDISDKLLETSEERKKQVETVFPYFNFEKNRTLLEGCASYYLALLCYEKVPAEYSPTIRKAQICLRLAWLCNDLDGVIPGHNYDYVKEVFYKKALFFYQEALNLETEHIEKITEINSMGPDLDKNYGFDGVVYLSSLLEYKYGQTKDMLARLRKLDACKSSIARIFGLGKSSKAKPGPLLEHSRTLYESLKNLLKDSHEVGFEVSEDDD